MKRLRVILLFLLLGAIINVAVAWGLALGIDLWAVDSTAYAIDISGKSEWTVMTYESFGSTRIQSDYLSDRTLLSRIFEKTEISTTSLLPSWGNILVFHDVLTKDPAMNAFSIHNNEARGWPLRTFWGDYGEADINWSNGRGLIYPPVSLWKKYDRPRALPFFPIWQGLIFNSLFYAIVLRLSIACPVAIHRTIRSKRGLCVKCAYDLRGDDHDTCPECGTLTSRARE